MLRPASEADLNGIVDVVVAAGMFTRDEAEIVDGLLREHLSATDHDDHRCLVVERDGRVVGTAYAQARTVTDRVWDLTMIGVRPDGQRAGDGTALIDAIERDLAASGARLMVVETSAEPQYLGARAFYLARGYDEEARIRDYWTDGDDLVVFRKRLRPKAHGPSDAFEPLDGSLAP